MADIITKSTVYNIFNAPKGKPSLHGEEIYEWEFLDENGKLQKDSKNVKEEINSFLPFVDYKAQIARGELENDGLISNVSRDFTGLPDNSVDYYKYLTALASLPEGEAAKLLESINQTSKTSVQGEQKLNQEAVTREETTKQIIQDQSTSGTSDPIINGGTK